MTIRSATIEEVEVLANMNHRLVEDMSTENWSHDRYRDRFRRWIEGHRWSVDLFVEDKHAVGYSVYQRRQDHFDNAQSVIFMRHFYIEREHRCRGLGRSAFDLLVETRFPRHSGITLDVLPTNPDSTKFWESTRLHHLLHRPEKTR
jgi:GNAT superfamily N-acetyltransferase